MAKKFKLLRRSGDGGAVYESNDESGYELLSIRADGTQYRHSVEGICADCATGRHKPADCPRPRRDTAIAPRPEPADEPVADTAVITENSNGDAPKPGVVKSILKLVESKPPVDPGVEQGAKTIAEWVWSRRVVLRAEIYQGKNAPDVDRAITHAVEMEWVLDDGEKLSPGTVNHRPMLPIGDVDSPAWGPETGIPGMFRTRRSRGN